MHYESILLISSCISAFGEMLGNKPEGIEGL